MSATRIKSDVSGRPRTDTSAADNQDIRCLKLWHCADELSLQVLLHLPRLSAHERIVCNTSMLTRRAPPPQLETRGKRVCCTFSGCGAAQTLAVSKIDALRTAVVSEGEPWEPALFHSMRALSRCITEVAYAVRPRGDEEQQRSRHACDSTRCPRMRPRLGSDRPS